MISKLAVVLLGLSLHASAFAEAHNHGGHGGGWGGPGSGHGGHGGHHDGDGHESVNVTCTATNTDNGTFFLGMAFGRRDIARLEARAKALETCERFSQHCIVSCEY